MGIVGIIIKVFLSVFAFLAGSVLAAFAFEAPISEDRNKKLVEITQVAIFYIVLGIVLYFIWTF